ncbi:MAG: alpha-L-fucosidase [Planctomycetota bacterium]|nr:MAG: alpha-L-fucosidase [Planctomycetota bacterium]
MTDDFVQDGAVDPLAAVAEPTPLPRIRAFEGLGFGLFVHFGLYSQLGQGEWVWYHHGMDRERYLELFASFDPSGFDADALCALAAEAGCRYVCLTTRHHEGFSLYDTRGLNTYDAPHACGRDLIAEYSAACEKHGLKKFFYHTTLDWWHPEFDGDWDAYQQYLRDSVEILCTQYGTVDGLWFDGNWARKDRDWQEDALYGMIRSHQPEIIIVNNSSIAAKGAEGHPDTDVVTFEQGTPSRRDQRGAAKYRAAEMCDTMNSHWGVGAHDLSHKAPADVIRNLVASRAVGGNLLMNIGPLGDGSIPGYERELLRLVGRWCQVCPQAIYDARPDWSLHGRNGSVCLRQGSTVFHFLPQVRIKGNTHLALGEPGDGLQVISGAIGRVRRISWADTGADLTFTQNGDHLMYEATPYPYGSQLVVRIAIIECEE